MAKIPFHLDLKKLTQDSQKSVEQLTKQLAGYEKRVKQIVHDMDVSTRDARKQGRDRLDRFLEDLRGRRSQLEKKVTELVSTESKKIHEGVNDLVAYLKVLRANGAASSGAAKSEKSAKPTASAKAPAKKKASGAKKSTGSATKSTRRKTTSAATTGAATPAP